MVSAAAPFLVREDDLSDVLERFRRTTPPFYASSRTRDVIAALSEGCYEAQEATAKAAGPPSLLSILDTLEPLGDDFPPIVDAPC
jgi:hypothetical protein